MLIIGDVCVSDEVLKEEFVCNLKACKGACCKSGESGAPLEPDELLLIESEYAGFESFLEDEGRDIIGRNGNAVRKEGSLKTPLMPDGRCAYSVVDEKGHLCCGIEKAHEAGKSSLRKPISCHLFPIRIEKRGPFEHLRYERWDICSAACALGRQRSTPMWKFVRDALIRKYGEGFVRQLEEDSLDQGVERP